MENSCLSCQFKSDVKRCRLTGGQRAEKINKLNELGTHTKTKKNKKTCIEFTRFKYQAIEKSSNIVEITNKGAIQLISSRSCLVKRSSKEIPAACYTLIWFVRTKGMTVWKTSHSRMSWFINDLIGCDSFMRKSWTPDWHNAHLRVLGRGKHWIQCWKTFTLLCQLAVWVTKLVQDIHFCQMLFWMCL